MSAYLVRVKSNRELVGIINADSLRELALIVDEAADIDVCEYVKLPRGGILWEGSLENIEGGQIPYPEPDKKTGEGLNLPWAESSLSENWFDVFYNPSSSLRWRDLEEVFV